MIPINCIEVTDVSKILFSERGAKVCFLNLAKETFKRIRVDGCVTQNQVAADWVLSKAPVGDLFVELKGKDIEHAIEQIEATLASWILKRWCCSSKVGALIVASQVPKAVLARKSMEKFRKDFRCKIKIVSPNREINFEDLL